MKRSNETIDYAQMGMAALLPGMVHMLELMQQQVDDFRTRLAALQGQASRKSPGRSIATGKNGWPDDPAARRAEMRRRMKVADRKRKRKAMGLSEVRKKEWAAMSPAKKKKRLAAMLAGKKKTPLVQLEAAS